MKMKQPVLFSRGKNQTERKESAAFTHNTKKKCSYR